MDRKSFGSWLVVLLGLLLGSGPTAAMDTHRGEILIYGYGSISCGQFVATVQTSRLDTSKKMNFEGQTLHSEKYAVMAYVDGYLTAINSEPKRGSAGQISNDSAVVEVWLTNYCTANPAYLLARALSSLVIAMDREKRIK